jgi:hypothetical protein
LENNHHTHSILPLNNYHKLNGSVTKRETKSLTRVGSDLMMG